MRIELPTSFMGKVAVISDGVDSISDGRVFIIGSWGLYGKLVAPNMIPPRLDNLKLPHKDISLKVVTPIADETSFECPNCGELYNRQLCSHGERWMVSSLACRSHNSRVLLDVFPKVDGGQEQDWVNAFQGFSIGQSLPERLGSISDSQSSEGFYLQTRRRIKPSFFLTTEGLKKID